MGGRQAGDAGALGDYTREKLVTSCRSCRWRLKRRLPWDTGGQLEHQPEATVGPMCLLSNERHVTHVGFLLNRAYSSCTTLSKENLSSKGRLRFERSIPHSGLLFLPS